MKDYQLTELSSRHIVFGSGAAGFGAAARLHQLGERDLAIVTENISAGTSRNTGSDKQTYYKLSLAGADADSILNMAQDLFAGQCVDGDLALCEAALSAQCFYRLVELGVPFPCNEYGEFVGYQRYARLYGFGGRQPRLGAVHRPRRKLAHRGVARQLPLPVGQRQARQ